MRFSFEFILVLLLLLTLLLLLLVLLLRICRFRQIEKIVEMILAKRARRRGRLGLDQCGVLEWCI